MFTSCVLMAGIQLNTCTSCICKCIQNGFYVVIAALIQKNVQVWIFAANVSLTETSCGYDLMKFFVGKTFSFFFLSATSRASDYVLSLVCLCVIKFCNQDISTINLWNYAKFIADIPYILPAFH